jgi:CDP-diacylglycerol--serine O-phosphatidyltransferase
MIAPFDYPKPGPKHAVPMGVVQAVAVVAPTALFRAGPRAMLGIALLFFALGPWVYPGE